MNKTKIHNAGHRNDIFIFQTGKDNSLNTIKLKKTQLNTALAHTAAFTLARDTRYQTIKKYVDFYLPGYDITAYKEKQCITMLIYVMNSTQR